MFILFWKKSYHTPTRDRSVPTFVRGCIEQGLLHLQSGDSHVMPIKSSWSAAVSHVEYGSWAVRWFRAWSSICNQELAAVFYAKAKVAGKPMCNGTVQLCQSKSLPGKKTGKQTTECLVMYVIIAATSRLATRPLENVGVSSVLRTSLFYMKCA